ncbi:MAG: Hsp20/alpha crystallin family protein [Candidatus Bathyarchaeota archaeon]|nr:Hsp20/alpha crystallin family protein [Candidatus Bathyarchaeum sp.]
MKSLIKDDFWSRWFRKKDEQPKNKNDESGEIEEIINKIEKMLDTKFKELSETSLNDPKKREPISSEQKNKSFGHFIYGYSVTLGLDGEPRIRRLGSISPKMCPKKSKFDEQWDLLIDVISLDKEIQVVMELPGVTKKEIQVKGLPDHIIVVADSLKFNYYKKIPMPCIIDPESIKTKYINGVLEINLNKAEKIKID